MYIYPSTVFKYKFEVLLIYSKFFSILLGPQRYQDLSVEMFLLLEEAYVLQPNYTPKHLTSGET